MQMRVIKRGLSLILFLALTMQLLPMDFWSDLVPYAAAAESTVPDEYLYEYEEPQETKRQVEIVVPPTIIDERTEELFQEAGISKGEQVSVSASQAISYVPFESPEPNEDSAHYIEIIKNNQNYGELSVEDAGFLCAYTGIGPNTFQILDSNGYSLSDAVSYGLLAIAFGYEVDQITDIAPNIETVRQLEKQIALYNNFLNEDWIGTDLDLELRGYLLQGFSFQQVMNAYGVQQKLGIPMGNLLICAEQSATSSELQMIADDLGVSAAALAEYISNNDITVQDLEEMLPEIKAMSAQLRTGDVELYADTPDEEEETETSNRNLGAPYTYDSGTNEKVALNSGALIYESEDYTIPGVNGLDLVIARRYNAQEANTYKPKTTSKNGPLYGYYVDIVGTAYYDVPGIGEGRWPYYDVNLRCGPYEREEEAVTMKEYYNERSDLVENPHGDGANLIIKYEARVTPEIIGVRRYYSTSREANSSYNDLYGLGHGWSLAFSSVEIVDNAKYLHLANGNTYEISLSGSGSHLKDYPLGDMRFEQESGEFNNGEVNSEYTLYYKDGKREYFDTEGKLLGIQDRYNNTITFIQAKQNGYPHITITDTLGRNIIISGEKTEDGHDMTISLPMDTDLTYHVEERDTVQALASYTDAAGAVTQYGYSLDTANFSTVKKSTSGASNEYLNLTTVTHPTGVQSVYTYEVAKRNLGSAGLMEVYRLTSRKDVISGEDNNVLRYSYSDDDCSGYPSERNPESLSTSFTYSTTVSDDAGLATTTTFNNKHLQTSASTLAGEIKVQESSYEYNSDKLPVKISTKRYSETNQSAPLESIQMAEYDHKGNVTSEWSTLARGTKNNEYKISYTYDENYSILLSKTYKTDADTTVTMQNTLSGSGKDIARTEIFVNNALRRRTEYTSDGYGNITEQRNYRDGFSEYDVIQYGYLDHAYLAVERHTAILGADGENAQSTPEESAGTIATRYSYDELGRIIQSVDGNGQSTQYAYDKRGNVIKTTFPDGSSVHYNRDYIANTVTVTDENGTQTKYTYTPLGLEYETIDVSTKGVISRKNYDAMSRLKSKSDYVYGGTTEYSYDAQGRVISEIVKQGTTVLSQIEYGYDDAAENGLYAKVSKTVVGDSVAPSTVTTQYTDCNGNIVKKGKLLNGVEHYDTYTYDYVGSLLTECTATAQKNGYPFVTKYEYNGLGQAARVYNVYGQYILNTYNALGQLVCTEDYSGTPTFYSYDALGRVLTQTTTIEDGVTAVRKYAYDPCGNIIEELTPCQAVGSAAAWNKTHYEYDTRNRLVNVTQYDGSEVAATTQYTYDKVGNTLTMTAGGSKTTYTYDRFGNVLTQTDALGQKEKYTYSSLGKLTKKVDRSGQTKSYTYDGMGRMMSSTIGKETISTKYAKTGAVAEEKLYQKETQKTTTTSYSQVKDAAMVSEYLYDELGRTIQQTDKELDITTTTVKSGGGTTPIPGPINPPVSGYAVIGTQYKTTTSTSVRTQYSNQYEYDLDDARTGYTLINGQETLRSVTYSYDALGRMTEVASGGKVKATYTYDTNGNRASMSYANGTTTTYTYNRANWVTKVENPESSYSYTYYASGNQAGKMDQAGRRTSYSYDGLGRLTRESESGGQTLEYTYDPRGNRVTLEASGTDNYVVNYTYDANNRLLKEERTGSAAATTTYTYDKNGNMLTAAEKENGSTTTTKYSYDVFGRMTQVTVGTGDVIKYYYNTQGLRTKMIAGGNTQRYLWDGSQLAVTLGAKTEQLADFTIPSSGFVSLPAAGSGLVGGATYSVMLNGKLYEATAEKIDVEEPTPVTYARDDEQPEIPVDPPGDPVTPWYWTVLTVGDVELRQLGNGHVEVTGPAGTEVTVFDREGSEKITETYLRGVDLVAAEKREKDVFYHYNAHGDVVQLSNSFGRVFRRYDYDAFGVEKDPSSADVNLFRYCGEQYDKETGNYYLRARYYDPTLGRFTQEDTHWNVSNMVYGDNPVKWNEKQSQNANGIGLNRYTYKPDLAAIMQAGNLYGYALNNPVMYRDANGNFVITAIVVGAIVGAVIGGAVGAGISYSKYGEIRWQYVAGGALLGGVGGALVGWGAGAVVAKVGASAAAKGIVAGTGGAGFTTFAKLKDFLGAAGSGFQWHHIVEQCQAFKSGFDAIWINNTNNVVRISASVHTKISAYYSATQAFTDGMKVRDWLAGQSFEAQYKFGIKILRMFGVKI